jgi:UDP-3-O-[3-hydroxymyristoyl] glucosamine N-acyltransferase
VPSVPALSLIELCAKLNVSVPEGADGGRLFEGVGSLEGAGPGQVSYVGGAKLLKQAAASKAGLLLVPIGVTVEGKLCISLKDVMGGFLTLLEHFHPSPKREAFVHPSAVVGAGAVVGERVWIGEGVVVAAGSVIGDDARLEAHCVVGPEVVIGAGCWLHPRVTLVEKVHLGKRVEVHSGAVLGADGFRYEVARGRLCKVPQVGRVVIEDDVEIGANTTIDRAGLDETRVGARTKIDNQVQIGHNCVIGSDCVIVAQVGIAGSCRIGRGVMIGGRASIKDHVTIGDRCRVAGMSGVQNDLPAGSDVIGYPAMPLREHAKFVWFYRNFTKLWPTLRRLLKQGDA